MWETIIAIDDQSQENSSLAFRLLMSEGALLNSKLLTKRKLQPQKTLCLDLLDSTDGAHLCIAQDPECLHTPWSKSHHDSYLKPALSPAVVLDGRMMRIQICIEAEASIEILESLHASMRRIIKCKGVQCQGINFEDMNSLWVNGCMRRRDLLFDWANTLAQVQTLATPGIALRDNSLMDGDDCPDLDDDSDQARPQRTGGGGALHRP